MKSKEQPLFSSQLTDLPMFSKRTEISEADELGFFLKLDKKIPLNGNVGPSYAIIESLKVKETCDGVITNRIYNNVDFYYGEGKDKTISGAYTFNLKFCPGQSGNCQWRIEKQTVVIIGRDGLLGSKQRSSIPIKAEYNGVLSPVSSPYASANINIPLPNNETYGVTLCDLEGLKVQSICPPNSISKLELVENTLFIYSSDGQTTYGYFSGPCLKQTCDETLPVQEVTFKMISKEAGGVL